VKRVDAPQKTKGTGRDMFDTMTLTKLGGGFFGAWLVFLLGGWAADSIYSAPEHHGEGEEHAQAYVIEVEGAEPEATDEPAEDPVALFAAAFPTADAAAGAEIFDRRCSSCHANVAGENKTGPYLHGVVGRPVDAATGFEGYSGALETVFDVWTPENLNIFILNPKGAVAETAMNFAGLDDAKERADLIAYLDSLDG
jgi:cytochrome c